MDENVNKNALRHRKPSLNSSQKADRACLRCRKTFLSFGPFNRFCKKCAIKNEGVRMERIYSIANLPAIS